MSPTMATSDPLDDQLIDLNALIERYRERRNSGKLNAAEIKAYDREIEKAQQKVSELTAAQ